MLKTAEKFEWLRVSKKAECHAGLVSASDSAFFVSRFKWFNEFSQLLYSDLLTVNS